MTTPTEGPPLSEADVRPLTPWTAHNPRYGCNFRPVPDDAWVQVKGNMAEPDGPARRAGDVYWGDQADCDNPVRWYRKVERPHAPVSRPAGEGEREAVARVQAQLDDLARPFDNVVACEASDLRLILALLSPAAPDAGGRDDELIARSLRTIHAYDAVRYLRDALTATTARISGYDWNADPDGITRQQGDAFAAADKVFADLSAAVDAHPDIDLPECEACGGTGKIEEPARTTGANQHSACIRTCDECDGCGFTPDDSALQPGGER